MVENQDKKETVDEYLARGGKITVIPPGKEASSGDLSEKRRKRKESEGRALSAKINQDALIKQIQNSLEKKQP